MLCPRISNSKHLEQTNKMSVVAPFVMLTIGFGCPHWVTGATLSDAQPSPFYLYPATRHGSSTNNNNNDNKNTHVSVLIVGRGARCTEEACQNHKQVADEKDNGQDCHSWLSTRPAGQLLGLNRSRSQQPWHWKSLDLIGRKGLHGVLPESRETLNWLNIYPRRLS